MLPHLWDMGKQRLEGNVLKETFGVTNQATKEGKQLLQKEKFSLINNANLMLYCKLYWVL